MAYYKVSVDVSDLFDDMLVQAQKSFLITSVRDNNLSLKAL